MALNLAESGGAADRLCDLLAGAPAVIADALSALGGLSLQAGTPTFWDGPAAALPLPEEEQGWIVLPIHETAVSGGELSLVLRKKDAAVLLQSLLGDAEEVAPESFGDLHRSALSEAMAQVVFRLQKSLTDDLHCPVALLADTALEDDLGRLRDMPVVSVGFPLLSQNRMAGPVYLVVGQAVALAWKSRSARPSRPEALPRSHFPQLGTSHGQSPQNLHLLMDIQLQMVAVLGKRNIQLRELLQMGPGTVLELDRLAGEPLELIVNGKLVGYGEVVVVDDKLGIRVREMVQAQERLRSVNL